MDTPRDSETMESKKQSFVKELISYALVALVVVVPIRLWIAQPFIVSGGSMDTTFANGEYLIVDQVTYRFNDPERGHVLIFKYPQNPKKYFIKRLIGLPNETITIKDNTVTIKNAEYPEGIVLNEPYLHTSTLGNTSLTLGPDEYFVMGDNRTVSADSRMWGPLPKANLIGRPIVRLLPLSKIDFVPGVVASSTMTETGGNN